MDNKIFKNNNGGFPPLYFIKTNIEDKKNNNSKERLYAPTHNINLRQLLTTTKNTFIKEQQSEEQIEIISEI